MKKLVSILLVVVMLISIISITAYAYSDSYNEFPKVDNKFYDIAFEHCYRVEPVVYREFHHYKDDSNDEIDWALIAYMTTFIPWDIKYGGLVGDRVICSVSGNGENEFSMGYAVYIPETNEFIGVVNDNADEILQRCPNFLETLEEYGIGQLLGDIDESGSVDIMDATYIQRYIAKYNDHFITTVQTIAYEDFFNFSITDVNRDGETTIFDATAIQRKLAKIEDTVTG